MIANRDFRLGNDGPPCRFSLGSPAELRVNGLVYQIRPAEPRDRDQIIANINGAIAAGSFLVVSEFKLTDDWDVCLSCGLDRDRRRVLAVATAGEEVVGHCRLFPVFGGKCTAHVADVGFLVPQAYQRMGLGTALVSYILLCASELDYRKVILSTASENTAALRLATRIGFIEEGRRVAQYFIHGQSMDEILMAYFFSSGKVAQIPARQL